MSIILSWWLAVVSTITLARRFSRHWPAPRFPILFPFSCPLLVLSRTSHDLIHQGTRRGPWAIDPLIPKAPFPGQNFTGGRASEPAATGPNCLPRCRSSSASPTASRSGRTWGRLRGRAEPRRAGRAPRCPSGNGSGRARRRPRLAEGAEGAARGASAAAVQQAARAAAGQRPLGAPRLGPDRARPRELPLRPQSATLPVRTRPGTEARGRRPARGRGMLRGGGGAPL